MQEDFSDIYEKAEKNPQVSEDKLKRYFHTSNILESLGYEENDIKVEKTVKKGKRTDIHCTDEYGNVTFVVEFKKPSVKNLSQYESQLWKRYMKPLRADYGILYNGFEFIFYERLKNSLERIFKVKAKDIGKEKIRKIVQLLEKPDYDTQDIKRVLSYFENFEDVDERLKLVEEASREHFFQNFRLKKESAFGNLLKTTIDLFKMLHENQNNFLHSAYDFWKESYAKSPEEVPEDWKPLMEETDLEDEEDGLYKFMFCLETAYAIFTRLVLAKSAEDYDFPDVRFSGFIEKEMRDASRHDDIPQSAWAKITQELIGDLRRRLVSSVFEEDIFYWWTESFEDMNYDDFFKGGVTPEMSHFGGAMAKILLMLYKFNFSEIKGDPLGILYQKYFDKETRKALGEFYTPQEVVDYILDSVDYKGRKVLEKRLLDPACGSGTFLVTALQRYLEASEGKAKEEGWDYVLDDLCNKYRIVGFDIHPFATIMAQIQFMLVLLPKYKLAVEDADEKGELFKLQRIPIFRTDSLKKETESGGLTLTDYENGKKIGMEIKLPVQGDKEGFFDEEFHMPEVETALSKTDIHNNEEYFGALQALFDVIKEQAKEVQDSEREPEFDRKEFERRLKKHYLSDKNWSQISSFFEFFGNDLLDKIETLQTEFDDGRLVKSIEDIFLAALLKNEQKYDYVVGNPPYVRVQNLSSDQKTYYKENYKTAYGKFDLYSLFMERGLNWLHSGSKCGFITSNQFMMRDYGEPLREILSQKSKIGILDDFGDSGVFPDATNYPLIITYSNEEPRNNDVRAARIVEPINESNQDTIKKIKEESCDYYSEELDIFSIPQSFLGSNNWKLISPTERQVFEKIENNSDFLLKEIREKIMEGFISGRNKVFILTEEEAKEYNIEKEVLKSIPKGRNIERWAIDVGHLLVIYPYEIDGDEIRPVDLNNYPNLKDYMEDNREELEDRDYVMNSSKSWYELWNPRNPMFFESKKLITPNISQSNRFAYDLSESLYVEHDSYLITLESKSRKKYLEILGMLNSKVLEFYLKQISPFASGKYYRYMKTYLDKLPLIETEILSDKVEEILSIIKRKERNDEITLYAKDHSEKNVVEIKSEAGHSNISPSIQETQDGMYGVIIGKRKKEDPILVDTKEKARFVKLALEGKSVKKDEEIEVLVPKSNNDVKEILEEYEEDKKKLEEMPTVEELEEEINQIVYDLYGLDEEDIGVIEDFLEKF